MRKLFMLGMLMAAVIYGCSRSEEPAGVIRTVVGKAWVISGTVKHEARPGDLLKNGDAVETGDTSVVIADILGGAAQVEIQKNALFKLESVAGDEKTVAIDRGNLWLKVNKLLKNGAFRLKTPHSIAAVRGTKMYRFVMGEMDGICHCEGDVDYRNNDGTYKAIHHRDHMVFWKRGVSFLLSQDDLAFMMTPGATHCHSELDDSPLGPKAQPLTKDQQDTLAKLIEMRYGRN